uniref:Uncharacterized protein n=1 Tax=Anguilla anguilla TaxID=7936 RepID=A0A0E9XG74_ANGAN
MSFITYLHWHNALQELCFVSAVVLPSPVQWTFVLTGTSSSFDVSPLVREQACALEKHPALCDVKASVYH